MQGVDVYEENANADDLIEQFVLDHQALVRKIALYIKRRLPSHIELDDLLQAGLVGLLEAREHFKPGSGATFVTFASIRIRGAIIDYLRKNSWVSRETIKNMRMVSEAINKIEQRNKTQATSELIAAELEITMEEYSEMLLDISICNMMSLNDIDENDSYLKNDVSDPEEILQGENLQEHLKDILMTLPEREQLVLSLYYVEELTLKQIGEVLELTEARVCQLHSQAIARVRTKMQGE
ncbi:MAG: sigma-70 family RNA polymerase sigma factor [Gammaproteobacteria bacterium]